MYRSNDLFGIGVGLWNRAWVSKYMTDMGLGEALAG